MLRLKRFVLSLILALSLLGSALVASPSSHLLAEAARTLHGLASTQTTITTQSHKPCPSCGSSNQLLATGGSGSGGDPGNDD
jgi:hypothetical protein